MPKKRNRDPLAEHAAEKRREKISQVANYYLGKRALTKLSSPERRKVSEKNRAAAKVAWGIIVLSGKPGSVSLNSTNEMKTRESGKRKRNREIQSNTTR